jgi:hypothetical protein
MRILFYIIRMPSTRRNRNGPVSRVFAPVNEGLGLATRSGSRVIRTGNSVWRTVGNSARNLFSNATHSVNTAGRRLITGKRGGSRRSRKERSRKNRSRKERSRKNRK